MSSSATPLQKTQISQTPKSYDAVNIISNKNIINSGPIAAVAYALDGQWANYSSL